MEGLADEVFLPASLPERVRIVRTGMTPSGKKLLPFCGPLYRGRHIQVNVCRDYVACARNPPLHRLLGRHGRPVRRHAPLHGPLARIDDVRIKLRAFAFPQPAHRFIQTQARTVRAVGRHRFQRICDGDDARIKGNLIAAQVVEISLAVEALVVVAHTCDVRAVLVHTANNFRRFDGMLLNNLPLLGSESAGLCQNRFRYRNFADIVQQRRATNALDVRGGSFISCAMASAKAATRVECFAV